MAPHSKFSENQCDANRNKEKDHIFKFGEKQINMTDKYKYLGTVISNDKDIFKQNLKNLTNKSNNAIYALNALNAYSILKIQ